MKTFCWYDLQEKVFMCCYGNVGRHFLKSNNVGAIFARIFRDFAQIFRDLPGFLTNQTFGGALAPPPPKPLLDAVAV